MAKQIKPHKPQTGWSDKDKDRVARVYKSLGNQAKTVEVTGVPARTLAFWLTQDWWKERMNQLRAEDSTELEEAATSIAKKSQEVVQERLANGDFVLDKEGNLRRKPVSAKDAAVISAISIDKRKILQEEPLREQQLGSTERLLKLFEQFTRFANAKEIKPELRDPEALEVIEETQPITGLVPQKDDLNVNA